MATASSGLDYARLCRETDPWVSIPARYNLGHALTRGNVEAGRGSPRGLTPQAPGLFRLPPEASMDIRKTLPAMLRCVRAPCMGNH